MTSNKPYLLRALYEWICDNECTPYLYVETESKGLLLPESLRNHSPLILNISPAASVDLSIDAEAVSFTARFSGQVFEVYLPMQSIIAIVTKETGQGMSFPEDLIDDERAPSEEVAEKNADSLESRPKSSTKKLSDGKKSVLKIIK